MDERLMTPAEAAARLKVGRTTIYRMIERGELDAIRVTPKAIRVRTASVERLFDPAYSVKAG